MAILTDQERLIDWVRMDLLPLAREYMRCGEEGSECEDRKVRKSYERDMAAITAIAGYRFGPDIWGLALDTVG